MNTKSPRRFNKDIDNLDTDNFRYTMNEILK